MCTFRLQPFHIIFQVFYALQRRSSFSSAEACVLKILLIALYLFISSLVVMLTVVFLGMARCHSTKSAEAHSLISKCGEGLMLNDDVLNDLKNFVIRYIYGDTQSSTLNQTCATKWKSLKKKSLKRLPPDDDSLEQHIKHANFLAYCHPDLRRHPSPIGHGWELVNGYCRPVRHTKLPFQVHFKFHQHNRISIALTLTPIQKLSLKLHLVMIMIVNHQLNWSHQMNLELD